MKYLMIPPRLLWRGLLLGLLLLTGVLISLLLPLWVQLRKQSLATRRLSAQRWWLQQLCRCLHLELHRDGTRPPSSGLLIANHISWLDIPVLGSLVPCQFLAKAEVARWPLIGWLCRQAGTRFIRRGQGETRQIKQQLNRLIEQGTPVLIFPEGTTTDGLRVRRFHHQLLGAATDQPVYPVVLSYWQDNIPSSCAPYIGRDIFIVHLLRLLTQPRLKVQVSFLPPLASTCPRTQARQAQGLVRLGLQRHQRAFQDGWQGDEQVRSFYTG